jgi:hypothetical protein
MRKTLVAKLALAGTVGLVAAMASGNAQADCSACHTMHNSQDGISMRFDAGDTPLPVLLRGTCISCHTADNTLLLMKADQPPGVIGDVNEPTVVIGAGGANQMLAGGNFWWVNNGAVNSDSYGHNVKGYSSVDGTLNNVPPGFNGNFMVAGEDSQLECAGAYGCHGDRSVLDPLVSLAGAHHSKHNVQADDLLLGSIGDSYRFLDAVDGSEDSNWQFDAATGARNVYRGVARANNGVATPNTISNFCGNCHDSYHVGGAAGFGQDGFGINVVPGTFAGSWLRHPTDYDMATSGEFASYITYSFVEPVASAAENDMTINSGQRIVMCLSCHFSHGYKYADMLRWDYTLQNVLSGRTDGCLNCHRAKN